MTTFSFLSKFLFYFLFFILSTTLINIINCFLAQQKVMRESEISSLMVGGCFNLSFLIEVINLFRVSSQLPKLYFSLVSFILMEVVGIYSFVIFPPLPFLVMVMLCCGIILNLFLYRIYSFTDEGNLSLLSISNTTSGDSASEDSV